MRYVALICAGLLITGGFIALAKALQDAGERIMSTLGFSATVFAGPLFLIKTSYSLSLFVGNEVTSSGPAPAWEAALAGQALVVDLTELVLTYLATAAFAAALGTTGWLRPSASRLCIGVSLFAWV